MKMVIGNLLFLAVLFGWWTYSAGNHTLFGVGAVFCGLSMIIGLGLGIWCSVPGKSKSGGRKPVRKLRRSKAPAVDVAAFDEIA